MVAGTHTTIASLAFDPVQHRYWQLREASGTIVWETSADAASWTSRGQAPTPFDVSSVEVVLSSGTYLAIASPGVATYGHFDLP